jgi:5-(carboxyamino)imidazole ribonucleotide synthase
MVIGILGGGQLGRMLLQEASRLDLHLKVMDISRDYPAGSICPEFVEGDFTKFEDVVKFGEKCDILTIEIESVNIDALKHLQSVGKKIFPQPEVIEIIADKGLQKLFYSKNGIPTSDFSLMEADELNNLKSSKSTFKPFVQKVRVGGYDGRGVQLIKNQDDATDIWLQPSVIEELVDIEKEISIVVCRDQNGEVAVFPSVEMSFHPTANLVEFLFSPSSLTNEQEEETGLIAKRIAERLGIVGLLAVEMFLDKSGRILVNEVAPRPHNSGHHTIEACITSQFEQHLRAISGLPLGDTELILPAVMINLLGELGHSGPVFYEGLSNILKLKGVYPHIYGKKETRYMRKMGHVTVINKNLEVAKQIAHQVQKELKVISK